MDWLTRLRLHWIRDGDTIKVVGMVLLVVIIMGGVYYFRARHATAYDIDEVIKRLDKIDSELVQIRRHVDTIEWITEDAMRQRLVK
jgi:hypothetical protein